MAQTRRVGKHNQRAYLPKAPRFSPYRNGQITPKVLLVHSPFPRLHRFLKLTRMGHPSDPIMFLTLSVRGLNRNEWLKKSHRPVAITFKHRTIRRFHKDHQTKGPGPIACNDMEIK